MALASGRVLLHGGKIATRVLDTEVAKNNVCETEKACLS